MEHATAEEVRSVGLRARTAAATLRTLTRAQKDAALEAIADGLLAGADRIVADPAEIVRRQPDIVIGSWCGKKFRPEKVAARAGWADVPAVRHGELHEIKSADILQPGPAALTDGVAQLAAIVIRWSERHG